MDVSISKTKEYISKDLSLLYNPIDTSYYFGLAAKNYILEFLIQFKFAVISFAVISIGYYGIHFVEGPHMETVKFLDEIGIFAGWWIGLGILSSVGFGSGLHTFVLYLGPHVANVALIAGECNTVPDMLPSRWNFHHFKDCSKGN